MAPPPAPTLSVIADAYRSVKCTVGIPTVTGLTLSIWRETADGTVSYVRGAVGLTAAPGALMTVFDYEAPIGVPLTYFAQVKNAGGELSPEASAAITLTAAGCEDTWLTNLAYPLNTEKVELEGLDQLVYAVPAGVHKIIGRRSPIVSSDVAQLPAFELSYLTETPQDREAAVATLGDGIPVLLRTPPENGIGNLFFSVLDFTEQRIVKKATVQDRRYVVNGQEVARPDPALYVPLALAASYKAVRREYDDYAEVKALRATYLALLETYFTEEEAGTVEPWPEDDA